jgi:hypothetical protein
MIVAIAALILSGLALGVSVWDWHHTRNVYRRIERTYDETGTW